MYLQVTDHQKQVEHWKCQALVHKCSQIPEKEQLHYVEEAQVVGEVATAYQEPGSKHPQTLVHHHPEISLETLVVPADKALFMHEPKCLQFSFTVCQLESTTQMKSLTFLKPIISKPY